MRRVYITFVLFTAAIGYAEHQDRTEAAIAAVSQQQGQEEIMQQPQQQAEAVAVLQPPSSGYRPVTDAEYRYVELFRSCGARHGIDPALLAAVADVESSYRDGAVSHKGAQGLMQFMPATALAMRVDPWDPASAICGTAEYLKTSFGVHGNWDETIAAYNAGDPAVTREGVSAADGSYVADVQAGWTARRSSQSK